MEQRIHGLAPPVGVEYPEHEPKDPAPKVQPDLSSQPTQLYDGSDISKPPMLCDGYGPPAGGPKETSSHPIATPCRAAQPPPEVFPSRPEIAQNASKCARESGGEPKGGEAFTGHRQDPPEPLAKELFPDTPCGEDKGLIGVVPGADDKSAEQPRAGEIRISEKAMKNRMYRIMKPNAWGVHQVSDAVLKQWKGKGKGRDNLEKLFSACAFDKDRSKPVSSTTNTNKSYKAL